MASNARHHAEWLSLIDISGPFLSMPVLLDVFPQGLDEHDPDHFALLRDAYEEWLESQDERPAAPAPHTNWVRFVLGETLQLPDDVIAEGQSIPPNLTATIAEHGETLRPDLVVRNPESRGDGRKERLLVHRYPAGQNLDGPVPGKHWKASPATRMMELLHGTGVRLGLVTNGEQWTLVDAPRGETTGYASWYAHIWLDEKITLRAFRSLLGRRRFFGVPDEQTLEAMLAASAENQQEVTDQLGYQVRRAVEVLVQTLDRLDQDTGRELLTGVAETTLYEAALTVMMRLVFLFCAEERGLLLLGDDVYDENYSVSKLGEQLREVADQHGEEVLERRHDAWCRLLATFRAVHGGVRHDRMRLLAYSGSLFDPDRFPFLEGREQGTRWRDHRGDAESRPIPVDNRTVLHLLESLQWLQVKVPGGGPAEPRRLSFRALDIEQIGHVYEGLLDHTAKRAPEPILGLQGSKDKEPEVPLSQLEALRAESEDAVVEYVAKETGRSKNALRNALTPNLEAPQTDRLLSVCGGSTELRERVAPFAGLVRLDSFEDPVVIPRGSVYVTAGTDRRSSGTHYTPRSLTEPIVQYTLEPLVYLGPAEGKPKEEWQLRPAAELLDLRICDMACGSGAFLVQACRYMSERLAEAWEDAERQHPGVPGITPLGVAAEGSAAEQIIPQDPDERLAFARRLVAQRCLYGVDINPLAVEMAKLSLWLLTLAKDKPFTFLDHAIRCGDSLVGIRDLRQLEVFNLDGQGESNPLFLQFLRGRIERAVELRRRIEERPADRPEDVEAQAELMRQAEEQIGRLKWAADMLVAADFQGTTKKERDAALFEASVTVAQHFDETDTEFLRKQAEKALGRGTADGVGRGTGDVGRGTADGVGRGMGGVGRGTADGVGRGTADVAAVAVPAVPTPQTPRPTIRPFHWPLEFPEVLVERGGFDAFVCNPPFMGGQKIRGNLGSDYREQLVRRLAGGMRGTADVCAYFFLQGAGLLRDGGQLGFLATNTIAQGDTREIGIGRLIADGYAIPRAVQSRKWPGAANLSVAHVWIRRGAWAGPAVLGDVEVPQVTSWLTAGDANTGSPETLLANSGQAFIGVYVLGMGFVLDPASASALVLAEPRNAEALSPYMVGEDLTSTPDQTPSRWVINFSDWPLSREASPPGYVGPTAEDYPMLLGVVRETVRPERLSKRDRYGQEHWWQFMRTRPEMRAATAAMNAVLVVARTAKYRAYAYVPSSQVLDINLVVFAFCPYSGFCELQSSLHEAWVNAYSSTLETRQGYRPSDCFETYPFPATQGPWLATIGEAYHEHRRQVMLDRWEGLTKTYNRFHDPQESAEDIGRLRELHVEMDHAVAAAYGWTDLELGHGFHETKQGLRYTISDPARREVLSRLLQLNHDRYAEEVAQGLHEKKAKGKGKGVGRKATKGSEHPTLEGFDDE